MVIFDRHLGKLLKGGAVITRVLHAGLGKNAGHDARPQQALFRDSLGATRAAQQATAHLLNTNRQHDVVDASLHPHPGLAKGGGTGRAGVGHVDHRYAGLTDLLQNALAYHAACLPEVAAPRGLYVAHVQARVVERQQRRLGSQ